MADPKLIAAAVLASLAVTLIAIAVIICLSISSKFPAGDTKRRLSGAAALTGLTTLFIAATGFVGYFYARAKATASTATKGLLITMIVLAIITVLMYLTTLGLLLSVRARQEITTVDKNALSAALVLIAISFVSAAISIALFISIKQAAVKAVAAKKTTVTDKVVPAAEAAKKTTTTTTVVKKAPPPIPARPARAIIPARVVKSAPAAAVVEVPAE